MKDHLIYYDEIKGLCEKLNSFIKYGPTDQEAMQFLKNNFQFIHDEQSFFFGKRPEDFGHLWLELSDDEKRELARPLSARQLFCAERITKRRDQDTLWALWDFLYDYEQIDHKTIMSMAEMASFALMLRRIYEYLA